MLFHNYKKVFGELTEIKDLRLDVEYKQNASDTNWDLKSYIYINESLTHFGSRLFGVRARILNVDLVSSNFVGMYFSCTLALSYRYCRNLLAVPLSVRP